MLGLVSERESKLYITVDWLIKKYFFKISLKNSEMKVYYSIFCNSMIGIILGKLRLSAASLCFDCPVTEYQILSFPPFFFKKGNWLKHLTNFDFNCSKNYK